MLVMELLSVLNRNMRVRIIDWFGAVKTSRPSYWVDPKYFTRKVHEINFHEDMVEIDLEVDE